MTELEEMIDEMNGFTLIVYSPKDTRTLDKGDFCAMTFEKHHLRPEETGIFTIEQWLEECIEKATMNGHTPINCFVHKRRTDYHTKIWNESEMEYDPDTILDIIEEYSNV